MIRHKYHAQKTECDGIKFSSKKEASYYQKLLLAKQAGIILFFLRQVPFHLPGNTKYTVDFVEFHADGKVRFVDVKGARLRAFVRNKKMVEDLYRPVVIEEV